MADIFSKEKRSDIMSRIRSSGTKPEKRLYALLREALGRDRRVRVLKQVRRLPGNPDLVVPALRLAVFCDGCFFHGCSVHGHVPKSNAAYWQPKIIRNITRDRRERSRLRREGFAVWRFWEHDLRTAKGQDKVRRRLKRRLLTLK